MKDTIAVYIHNLKNDRRRKRRAVSMLCALSLLVSSTVFWQLRLVGITLSNDACCGKAEHIHSEECNPTNVLICGMTESVAETIVPQLTCEISEHIHSDPCYEENTVLVCTAAEEDPEHVHDDTCYEMQYVLSCQEQEHTHSEVCYSNTEADSDQGHVHTEECYETVYSCGFAEEHEHTVSCYSDPSADLESRADWEATLPASRTSNWPQDLIAIAQSQYGYRESENNFILATDGETIKGYSRYGEWAGSPYTDWNAIFVAFCLHYAGVPESAFPVSSGVTSWLAKLDNMGLYATAAEAVPQEGDLVFFHDNMVGVLIAVRDSTLYIIAGDVDDAVWQGTYDLADSAIAGYGCLNRAYQQFIGLEDVTNPIDDADAPTSSEAPSDDETQLPEDEPTPGETPSNDENQQPDDEPLLDEEDNPKDEAEMTEDDEAPSENEDVQEEESLEIASFALRASSSDAPDYIGTIQTANTWQIVSQRYTGRAQSNKVSFDDDSDGKADVYLQKNVVSTNTENEFLVYLSADRKLTWEALLDNCSCVLTSANKKLSPGECVSSVNGSSTIVYDTNTSSGLYQYLLQFNIYEKQGDTTPLYQYSSYRYGGTPNCANGSLYLCPPGINGYMYARNRVSLKTASSGNSIVVDLYLDQFPGDFAFFNTVFDSVTDILGENIEFLGIEDCDGTASFDGNTNTLTWLPIANSSIVSAPSTGSNVTAWDENIVQLVYRVRLNTEANDFHSCANNMNSVSGDPETYAVNQSAVLSYRKEALSGTSNTVSGTFTATFPVPEVRGLRYDITFEIKNEQGERLPGAVFGLYEEDGVTPVTRDGEPYTVTTDADGITKFRDLPNGNYVLKEITPPTGYSVEGTGTWDIPLSYTDYPSQLEQDFPPSPTDINNMRWSGNDNVSGSWQIYNTKNPFTYQIEVKKIGTSGSALSGATFTLTPSDPVLQGTTDNNGLLRFEGNYSPDLEYTITETSPPDGYYMISSPIGFKVQQASEGDHYELLFSNSDELADDVTMELIENADTAKVVITVKNHAGYVLPETGGMGTIWFTFGGLLLMTAALMYGYMMRRSQERRSRK